MPTLVVANLRTRRVETALAEMSPQLRKKYVAIGEHLGGNVRRTLGARYEIGVVVRDIVEDEATYGAGAMRLICDALGLKKTSLYDAASVARRWSREAFRDRMDKPTLHRVPLSFSHFVVLAEVDDAARRDELLDIARREGLVVRELRNLARQASRKDATPRASSALESSVRLASALVKSGVSLRESMALLLAEEQGPELVCAAADAYRALRAEVEATLAVLESHEASRSAGLPRARKVSGALWGMRSENTSALG